MAIMTIYNCPEKEAQKVYSSDGTIKNTARCVAYIYEDVLKQSGLTDRAISKIIAEKYRACLQEQSD